MEISLENLHVDRATWSFTDCNWFLWPSLFRPGFRPRWGCCVRLDNCHVKRRPAPPPPPRAPAVTSLSRFPVRIILVFWAAELDTDPSSSTCQPSSIDHRSRNNCAEQYCLSIILSSAIAFVEVRNICTDTRDTRKCLGTRCTHSLQVFVLFSYQLSSMLTLMCLLACFCLLKKQRAFLSYGGG